MALSDIREGGLKSVFQALEDAFNAIGTDYYIIGALARDVWFARGQKRFRATRDVDLAVLVGNLEEYEVLQTYLRDKHGFTISKTNAFVLIAPDGVEVDILPFGAIAINDSVRVQGQGLTTIKVNGFEEVYNSGTQAVELETGHLFEVATLSAIVLLKLISYDDRPEKRAKDPRDIANIIEHYFNLNDEHIWSNHFNLFTEDNDERSLDEIAATVIGTEIKVMIAGNSSLTLRIIKILEEHIGAAENSGFIRQMVAENRKTVEDNVNYLKALLAGLH
jgi:predicted nucleotidyltransferase